MAMEHEPFIGDFPIRTSIHTGFFIAMFDCQRVITLKHSTSLPRQYVYHRLSSADILWYIHTCIFNILTNPMIIQWSSSTHQWFKNIVHFNPWTSWTYLLHIYSWQIHANPVGVVIILNAVIMGLETDSESAFFEWTEQVPLGCPLGTPGSTAEH